MVVMVDTNMNYVCVITARGGSKRLPLKNIAPFNGETLYNWSLFAGHATGYPVIFTTDLITNLDPNLCTVVRRPPELATDDCSHEQTIRHALQETGHEDKHCILLQPTSPFRSGDIINRCIEISKENPDRVVLTTQSIDVLDLADNQKRHLDYWDGCVAIFPPDKICRYEDAIHVPNSYLNGLQIDTERDYVNACSLVHHIAPIPPPIIEEQFAVIRNALKNNGLIGKVTLVARPDGKPIPQEDPVIYLNHCRGYDGGRADALFLILNKSLHGRGINDELREVARKAKVVFLRNNGPELKRWLIEELPEICGKCVEFDKITDKTVNLLSTGVIANKLLGMAGCKITRVGFSGAAQRWADYPPESIHRPATSHEVAILNEYGKTR